MASGGLYSSIYITIISMHLNALDTPLGTLLFVYIDPNIDNWLYSCACACAEEAVLKHL